MKENLIIITSREDLESVLSKYVQNRPQVIPSHPKEEILRKQELSKKLDISISTINNYMRDDKIPYIKMGKSVFFIWNEVVDALKKNSFK